MSNIDELTKIRTAFEAGGGDEKISEQHKLGKSTARERLLNLFDENSFFEIDAFVNADCSFLTSDSEPVAEGLVTGYGSIDGRLVYAYAQDYTVTKGALSCLGVKKIEKVMDMALKLGVPVISIFDSQGVKIDSGLDILNSLGQILKKSATLSGVVPQISLVLGACAGATALLPIISDFNIMCSKNSLMFLNGPSVLGSELSSFEFGGAEACSVKSGVATLVGRDEEECFAIVKNLLSFLPSNNIEISPCYEILPEVSDASSVLNDISSDTDNLDIKTVINEIADNGEFFELCPLYAQNIVTGFIRMNGMTVGVVANQSKVNSGKIDIKATKKATAFISFCDSFNISILSVTNTIGFEDSAIEENNGILKGSASLLYAFSQATVPKVNLIIGKAYGLGYLSMNSKHIGADIAFAWPSAEISVMCPETAANILFNEKIAESENPITERQDLIKEYSKMYANPYVAASSGYIDDVFEPSLSRSRIINAFDMLMSKREVLPSRKHGNMPI